jgi:hypothetical protein
MGLTLDLDAFKAILELAELSACAHKTVNTSPRWVGVWINFELQCITLFSPCGTGLVLCAVSHDNINFMVIWVNAFFHRLKILLKNETCSSLDIEVLPKIQELS